MAKFKITSLNYIAHGTDRTLINMDVDRYSAADLIYVLRQEDLPTNRDPLSGDILVEQGSGEYLVRDFISKEFNETPSIDHAVSKEESIDDVILNEQFRYYQEDDSNRRAYIRLYNENNYPGLRRKLTEFNNSRHLVNLTFELEHELTNDAENQLSSANVIKALYDITDISLKSRSSSRNVNIDKFDPNYGTADIYLPNIKSLPKGFCQIDNDTLLLTDSTNDLPLYLRTSMNFDETDIFYLGSTFQYMKLASSSIPTYAFPSLCCLGTTSYAEYFRKNSVESFFTPKLNLTNVLYNYIALIPLNGAESLITDYELGNVYGHFYTTKNMYDGCYSTSISDLTSINDCREYIEINKSSGTPYLKYYDSAKYIRNSTPNLDVAETQPVSYRKIVPAKLPYQKIETFAPISYDTSTKHKSTLFSVKVNDTGLDESYDKYTYTGRSVEVAENLISIRRNIRQDITNTIREIAKNVCPILTLLFDVIFKG